MQIEDWEKIHDYCMDKPYVIVISEGKALVGAGSYKFYDDETMELKRIFLRKEYRGIGLGRELLLRLEADAKIQGFQYAILETGEPLEQSMMLYKKMKYKITPNYGQYQDMQESIYMKKKL